MTFSVYLSPFSSPTFLSDHSQIKGTTASNTFKNIIQFSKNEKPTGRNIVANVNPISSFFLWLWNPDGLFLWPPLEQWLLFLREALSPQGHCALVIHRSVIYTFIGSYLVLIKSLAHQFVSSAQPGREAWKSSESSCFKSQLIVVLAGWGRGDPWDLRGLTSVCLSSWAKKKT